MWAGYSFYGVRLYFRKARLHSVKQRAPYVTQLQLLQKQAIKNWRRRRPGNEARNHYIEFSTWTSAERYKKLLLSRQKSAVVHLLNRTHALRHAHTIPRFRGFHWNWNWKDMQSWPLTPIFNFTNCLQAHSVDSDVQQQWFCVTWQLDNYW